MLFWFAIFLFQVNCSLTCNPNICPPNIVIVIKRGDGNCDPRCMTSYCAWDSGPNLNQTNSKENSDCYEKCSSMHDDWCSSKLGDGICDEVCNTAECGYDFGDCGFCGLSCKLYLGFESQLTGDCNPACNVSSCYFGENSCRECSIGCNSTIWGDGECNSECNNPQCNYDNGDCFSTTCTQNCFNWMIGNSICDEACNVLECDFDQNDCGCSPNCSYDILGDGICNEECNTLECKFDNGDCGYCASGCSVKMLSNNICDPECNTFECEWDYYKCGCSEFCSADDYGKCKPECLIAECKYDQMSMDSENQCKNQSLVWFSIYQQAIRNKVSSIVNFEDCWEASGYRCTLAMALDQTFCNPECFIYECNYGLCYTNSLEDCENNLPLDAQNLCKSCISNSQSLGTSCNLCSEENPQNSTLSLFGLSLCYSKPIYNLFPRYSVFYFSTKVASGGSGTISDPYGFFDYFVFYHINCAKTIMLLINDGTYNLYSNVNFQDCWDIIIASADDSKAAITLSDPWTPRSWEIKGTVVFEDITFDGSGNAYNGCSGSEYCEYCAYITLNQTDGYYYSDRGERISKVAPFIDCFNPSIDNFFKPLFTCTNCNLTFRNTEIKNWRMEQSNIINCQGNLKMLNVSFDNIYASVNSSAVVSIDNSDSTQNYRLTYSGGSVTRLNNGFEFGDPLDFRGFLYAEGFVSVLIENVDFKYNFAYRGPKSYFTDVSLIRIDSPTALSLSNCTFMYNYFETSLIYITVSLPNSRLTFNESNYMSYFETNHFYFNSLKFISNYAGSDLISAQYSNTLLNFILKDSAFQLNGVGNGYLIKLENVALLDEYKIWTQKQITTQNGLLANVTIPPRWCKFASLNFTQNYAKGIIEATYMANLLMDNIIFDKNGSPYDDKNINNLVLDYFIRNSSIYIRKNEQSPRSIDCEFLVSISSSYNLDISSISLTNNICRASTPAIKILESSTKEIKSVNCSSNYGYGVLPVCFLMTGSFERFLTNSTFSSNKNDYISAQGAIQIEGSISSTVAHSTFFNNTGSDGAAISFSGCNVLVDLSTFASNYSPNGNGGSIYNFISATSTQCSFTVSSSIFYNSSATYGGGIYLGQVSSKSSNINLTMTNSTFTSHSANYGSAFYFDSSIIFAQSSIVSDCKFLSNSPKVSGSVSLYYSGYLKFKNCEFIGNFGAAGSSMIINLRGSLASKAIMEQCIFSNNKGGSIIFSDSLTSFSQIETRMCIFEYNTGSVLSLTYDSLVENGSIFRHNLAALESCLYAQNSAKLELTSTLFLNNTSSSNGGAISLKSKSSLSCNFCVFTANSAKIGNGGAIYVEEDSLFNVLNSTFLENLAEKDGAAIYNFNAQDSSITSSKFYNHFSKANSVLCLMSSNVTITSSYIYNNSSPGIKLSLSTVRIMDSEVRNQHCVFGCFLYSRIQSQAFILNSVFYDGNSTDGGGAIFSASSSIYIESSSFDQLVSLQGGAIYATYGTNLTIKASQFQRSYSSLGGIVNAYQSSISISNSQFSNFTGTGIYGDQLTLLEIKNSSFAKGSGFLGGGVYCSNCDSIYIGYSSFFDNQVESSGGALYLRADQEIIKKSICQITGCRLQDNIAKIGGGIYAEDINLQIYLSNFIRNEAVFDGSLLEKISYGVAGGVYIGCSKTNNCDFEIISSNFIENSASYKGGGIYFDSKEPNLKNNWFINNKAIYGDEIASYPVKLMRINEDGTLAENSNRRLFSEIPLSVLNLTDIASGQKIEKPLLIALVDSLNQVVRTDCVSTGEIQPISPVTVDGVIKVTAANGIFNFSSYTVSAEPGSDFKIKVFSPDIDTSKDLASSNSSSQSLYININMRSCKIGEVKAGRTCKLCAEGFYSLNSESTLCLACPKAAKCYGSYKMSPKPGYWRDNPYTDTFWKCPNPSACLGSPDSNNISYTGQCSKGYRSNKCQSCEEGYSRSTNSKCKECPPVTENIIIIVAIIFAFIIVASLMVRSTIKSALKPASLTPAYIKIFLNYLQLVNVASTFDLNWPTEVLEIFIVQNGVDYVYQQVYSFECLLNNEESAMMVYFKALVVVAVFPAAAFIVVFFIWALIKVARRSFKNFWDDYISTCIIVLFLIHSTLVKKLLSSFNCTEINPGEYWLKEDLSIRCWEFTHVFYLLTVTIPALIVWGILSPSICLINLVRQRKFLDDINVKLRYGFLFNGFNKKQYFWEFIILYSKLLLVCSSVFLTAIDIRIQALIAAGLLSLFWHIQFQNKPYTEASLNRTELTAKTVCLITIYSGIFYLTGSLSDAASLVLFVFIFMANIYFVGYWLAKISKASMEAAYKKIKIWLRSNQIMPLPNQVISFEEESFKPLQRQSRHPNISVASSENLLMDNSLDIKIPQESNNSVEEPENVIIERNLSRNESLISK